MKTRTAIRCADGVYRYSIDSISDAVTLALDDYATSEANRQYINARMAESWGGSWAHYFTRDKFLAELTSPSRALTDAVEAMKEKIMADVSVPTQPRRKIRRGCEFGDELDADRCLTRSMNPWDRSVREQVARRTVTIGANLTVNAGRRPEEMLYRGAAALALADILTSRGCNVEIVLFECAKRPTEEVEKCVTRITVKRSDMPMDVSALAFAMCEIAFIRIVGVYGATRNLPGTVRPGMGQAADLPKADHAGLDYFIEQDVTTQEAAEAWLQSAIKSNESQVAHV